AHPVAAVKQALGQNATDVAGATCDQDQLPGLRRFRGKSIGAPREPGELVGTGVAVDHCGRRSCSLLVGLLLDERVSAKASFAPGAPRRLDPGPDQEETPPGSRTSRAISCACRSSGSAVSRDTGLVISAKGTGRRPSIVAMTSRFAARFWLPSSPE